MLVDEAQALALARREQLDGVLDDAGAGRHSNPS